MWKYLFHPTLYLEWAYLSMLLLNLIHPSEYGLLLWYKNVRANWNNTNIVMLTLVICNGLFDREKFAKP